MKRRGDIEGTVPILTAGCTSLAKTDSSGPAFVQTDEWPADGYDVARTGVSPQSDPVSLSSDQRWSVEIGSEIRSTPIVVDGRVYVHDRGAGKTASLDEHTGEVLWKRFTGGKDPLAAPALDDERVYLNDSGDRTVLALDAETGDTEWTFSTAHGSRSIASADGTVFVGSDEGAALIALEAETGRERWSVDVGSELFGPPAIVDGTVYAGSTNSRVLALDVDDSTEHWRFDASGGVVAAPTVRDGTVYVGTQSGIVHALDRETGTEQWRSNTDGLGMLYPSPAVDDELLVVGTWNTGEVRAFDPHSGREQWQVVDLEQVLSVTSPVIAGDRVYFGSDDGLHAVDPTQASTARSCRRTRRVECNRRPRSSMRRSTSAITRALSTPSRKRSNERRSWSSRLRRSFAVEA
ncbi:PQQ-binding-like beta-propeller repeat protein [Natrinema sp. SYSU A 869]|uniref:outer membrane protein assembly factor BamB family protein n=1 Tax=Natrinema sp. SYSU A 869 TaxID=2871694 RepID=UPI001CA3BF4E|nr:PQQ-binding-like beta-propeller repeat protein [Natrinema sp. SYSU A 869]